MHRIHVKCINEAFYDNQMAAPPERLWRLGERRITLRPNDNIEIQLPIGPLTIHPMNMNMIHWLLECSIIYKEMHDIEDVQNKVLMVLRQMCRSRTNVMAFRTKSELKYSPEGSIIIDELTRDKRNPLTYGLSTRGKLSSDTIITILTLEYPMEEYPIDDESPIEFLYNGRHTETYYGNAAHLLDDIGRRGTYLAESTFYITKSGNNIHYETNSINAFNLFDYLIEQLDDLIEVCDYKDKRISVMNASGRIYGSAMNMINLEEYLTSLPTISHDEFWRTNQDQLLRICTKEQYDSINLQTSILQFNNINQKFWIDVRINDTTCKMQLTLLGSMIIVGIKRFDELHLAWLYALKIFIEACLAGELKSSDSSSTSSDTSSEDFDVDEMV